MDSDCDSWTRLLDQHGPALVLLARQWTGSRADAEDIVQDAFVRFWRSRERVQEPIAYLYSCVKHCALDWQRGQRRQLRREQAVARPEAEPLFIDRHEESERRRAIELALATLPETQMEVLIMKIWGGLSVPQIAAALEVSENTVASRYRYALARLREQLAEEPIV